MTMTMPFLTDRDLAGLRSVALSSMPTPATILRGGASIATTICSVTPEPASVMPVPADRLQPERRWVLRFPWSTDVQRGDTIQALGQSYSVVEEDGPRSFELAVQVFAIRSGTTADDVSTPTVDETTDEFLHTNALVQLQRYGYDATSKHTTLHDAGAPFPARVDDVSTDLAEEGSGPTFKVQLTCAGDIDIRDGDIVASIDPPPGSMPTVAQVQHVEVKRVNASLTYKVATVLELARGV